MISLVEAAPENDHVVQFYDDDGYLCDNVAQFLAAGIVEDEPVVVISTPAHVESFKKRLRLLGCDVDLAIGCGQLTMLDARATLDTFMQEDRPDWGRFKSAIGGAIEKGLDGRPGKRVRAFGEMVDLLWRDGNQQGALELERFWNDLAAQHSFSLMCAYVIGSFYKAAAGHPFDEVCALHTHVIPLEEVARAQAEEIAQRKQLEAALRDALDRETAARREAEQSVHFNEMFAGMLGHDLRSPLGAINVGAQFISRLGAGEQATKAAARIISSAERMTRMIDQLLDFTRIRVGDGIALDRTSVDLAELLYRVKDEIEAGNPDCSIRLDARGNAIGHWDYDRLLQVFSNLMGNAVSHGTEGCVVSVGADGTDSADLVVTVHNAGAVPDQILPVIFEAFRGSKQRKTGGLGLGLFITRQIVLAHGGSIDAASSPSEGTTLRVVLPRCGSK